MADTALTTTQNIQDNILSPTGDITLTANTILDKPQQQEETSPEFLARSVSRSGARIGETLLGLPGDILGGLLGIGSIATGGTVPTYEQIQERLPISFPTSQQIKEFHEPYTGEYLKPREGIEQTADNIIQTATALLAPNPIKVGALTKVPFKSLIKIGASAFARSFGGEAAKELTKALGGSPLTQDIVKFATLTASGSLGVRRALNVKMRDSYARASELSKGKNIPSNTISRTINTMWNKVRSGDKPARQFITERLKGIERNINKGKISADTAWELKKNMNEWLRDPNTPKGAIPYLKQLSGSLTRSLTSLDKKVPGFKKAFTQAEDIFKGLNKTSEITDFLKKNVSVANTLKNPVIKSGLLGGSLWGFGFVPTVAGLGIGTTSSFGAREASRLYDLLRNSKEARIFYGKSLASAAQQSSKEFARDVSKLDKVANSYFKKKGSNGVQGEITITGIPS